MFTQPARLANAPLPSPFPEGWYFVASRQDVVKAGLLQLTWLGEQVVLWYDPQGQLCMAEAFCPHLGSYLGPDAGGRICAGRLVCPFHGYQFDATGQCVATPYADPPRNARLRVFTTRDLLGLIFAWWSSDGGPPPWNLPATPEQEGWSSLEIRSLRFAGPSVQDVVENSVDFAHLGYVHGYDNVKPTDAMFVEGHILGSNFDFHSTRRIAKIVRLTVKGSVEVRLHGLGYSYVELREHSIGMHERLWVLPRPVDETTNDISLVSQVREIRHPRRRIVGLGWLPTPWRAPLFNKFLANNQIHDVRQDVIIWSRLRHRQRPRLCRSDGPIMPYRTYCAQFYPEQRAMARETPARPEAAVG